jgi:2-haloacid dehalogenase
LSEGNSARSGKPCQQSCNSSRSCLIACHTWDTLGAVAAGWRAALIKRSGNDVLDVGPQPQIVGNDLDDVANQLIARHEPLEP